ncbi:MAG: hypothetical protein J07HX64_02980 [halophilic archaeon J07HX64]|jgi:Predicted exonuclease|nr:MAG: hypothetical protein J07HX64_02980 [halophilic archaeon J07HX64]
MAATQALRALTLPSGALRRASRPAVRDALGYFDPHMVVVPGQRDPRAHASAREACPETPVVHPQLGRGGEPVSQYRFRPDTGVREVTDPGETGGEETGGVDILAVQSTDSLARLRRQLETGERRTASGAVTVLVVPDLSVEWDTTTLSTELPGRAELAGLGTALSEPVTVLAGGQQTEYSHEWSLTDDEGQPVSLRMAGLGATGRGGATFAQLTCTPRGTVAAEAVGADRFGLTSLTDVGPATADRLREHGYRTVDELRDAAVSDLAALPGLGRSTAETIHAHAEVIQSGDPLVLTNRAPVKTRNGQPPLCLDIETDGLTPTIIWQFGVYDPVTDRYRAFLQRTDPTDPKPALESFVTWFLAEHADRAVLTWNGEQFDYPCIERFLRQYLPGYLDAWNEVWTYDLYRWAVREGNALLPGRTNKLDHVARALDYDGADTGLTGAQTAAAYQEFMRNPDSEAAEPDWERHKAYCEDDCRALWHVYESIIGARRRDVTDSGSGGARGTQTGLTDFQ